MAELTIYAIRDSKISVFGRPFCEHNEVLATRGLSIALKDNTLQLSHFPKDFDLYKIGTFDEESGIIKALQKPEFVVSAVSVKQLSEEIDRVSNNKNNI